MEIQRYNDDYDDLFDDSANPDVPLYATGSNFEEDEGNMEGTAAGAAGMEGVAYAIEGADMDALESSNSTRGMNTCCRQNKKLKIRKRMIVVQYNVLGVLASDEATELASYHGVLVRTLVLILFPDWHKVQAETKECLWESIQVNVQIVLY